MILLSWSFQKGLLILVSPPSTKTRLTARLFAITKYISGDGETTFNVAKAGRRGREHDYKNSAGVLKSC